MHLLKYMHIQPPTAKGYECIIKLMNKWTKGFIFGACYRFQINSLQLTGSQVQPTKGEKVLEKLLQKRQISSRRQDHLNYVLADFYILWPSHSTTRNLTVRSPLWTTSSSISTPSRCGHRRRLAPELDAAAPFLAQFNEPILIAKINADKYRKFPSKYEIELLSQKLWMTMIEVHSLVDSLKDIEKGKR
ncbi:uncharacterized protein LOC121978346 [Zingiber officinale]|uniref:uncharacterized protein LOC121978346 n=1 Tax=Zingiber officinale TaxID=94328 RepID=UPI001C4AB0BB|nr:uncharacterized protein LOC121978346 [Zingiber officinale]